MKPLQEILLLNFAVMLIFMVSFYFLSKCSDAVDPGMTLAMLMMFVIPFQVLINLILSTIQFFSKKKSEGGYFLLAAVLVLVVGFSACWGAATMG